MFSLWHFIFMGLPVSVDPQTSGFNAMQCVQHKCLQNRLKVADLTNYNLSESYRSSLRHVVSIAGRPLFLIFTQPLEMCTHPSVKFIDWWINLWLIDWVISDWWRWLRESTQRSLREYVGAHSRPLEVLKLCLPLTWALTNLCNLCIKSARFVHLHLPTRVGLWNQKLTNQLGLRKFYCLWVYPKCNFWFPQNG